MTFANTLPYLAAVVCFLISSFGIVINTFVLYKLSQYIKRNKNNSNAFNKLCIVKTIPNLIICCAFFFWVVPILMIGLNFDNVPALPNIIIGQACGGFVNLLAPAIHVFMAVNRSYVLFFPIKSMKTSQSAIIQVSLTVVFVFLFIWTVIGFRDTCGYVFDPDILSWRPEPGQCAADMGIWAFYMVTTMSVISMSFNFATLVKLISNKASGMSNTRSSSRRKKTVKMFVQSVIQDLLHLFDMINATIIWTLYDELWYQFIFLSLSLLLIYTLDGMVMFYFHSEIHPTWWNRMLGKVTTQTIIVPSTNVSRTSNGPTQVQ